MGMMLIGLFLLIMGAVAIAIAFFWNVLEGQRKKKVTEMLETAVGTAQQIETKVLLDREEGGISALAKLVSHFNFAKKLETMIQQSGLSLTVSALLIQMLVGAGIGALLGTRFHILMFTVPSIALLTFVGGLLPYIWVARARSKRLGKFEEQFPEALDFLSRAMRAGHAFSIALEMLSEESPQPLGAEFRKVFNEHNLGLPIETALGNLTERVPMVDTRFFVSAVLLQRETGGNLAEILTKLAFVIRERFKLKGVVKAASAHGRITGSILTLMPAMLAAGLTVIAPTYLKALTEDPDGKYLIAAAITFVLIGHFVIRKIVDIKV